jgi:dienelactone hydrolase
VYFPSRDPIHLKGALRRPDGRGRFAAVVLLPSCNGDFLTLDDRWGKVIASWRYVTLSVDSLGPRNIKDICAGALPIDMYYDPYQALRFLSQQAYVDRARIAVVGFSRGGFLALWSAEKTTVSLFAERFRAAAAFYPPCEDVGRHIAIPTLILVGERDDWTPAKDCRNLAAGASTAWTARNPDDLRQVRLIVYPDAHHAFDAATLQPGQTQFGHWLEYNKAAADQAAGDLRSFLDQQIGRK